MCVLIYLIYPRLIIQKYLYPYLDNVKKRAKNKTLFKTSSKSQFSQKKTVETNTKSDKSTHKLANAKKKKNSSNNTFVPRNAFYDSNW